uniref:Uncharacterized protein n=1 Tax=Leersia perrieri TaxID=77586 RepID=A0A0D9WGE0_9ORYZ
MGRRLLLAGDLALGAVAALPGGLRRLPGRLLLQRLGVPLPALLRRQLVIAPLHHRLPCLRPLPVPLPLVAARKSVGETGKGKRLVEFWRKYLEAVDREAETDGWEPLGWPGFMQGRDLRAILFPEASTRSGTFPHRTGRKKRKKKET